MGNVLLNKKELEEIQKRLINVKKFKVIDCDTEQVTYNYYISDISNLLSMINIAEKLIEQNTNDYYKIKKDYSMLEEIFIGLQTECNQWKKRALKAERERMVEE